MERITRREWKTIVGFRREIKIGIAKDMNDRNRAVDLGIPGKVVLLIGYKVNQASKIETELHRKYKRWNFHVKGAKSGAGGTEFHRLTSSQVRQIKKILQGKSRKQTKPPFLKIVFWSIVLVVLVHYLF